MPAPSFWGSLVFKLREEQQISQRTLSALAHVNRATLRRMETGETHGEVDVLERLLDCLGYELEALRIDSKRRECPGEVYRTPERRSKLAAMRILSFDLSYSPCPNSTPR